MTYKEAIKRCKEMINQNKDVVLTYNVYMKAVIQPYFADAIEKAIEALKEVEKHKETFEWCKDCKEYDQKEHCCHRWIKCIRDTLDEQKTSDKYRWHDIRKDPNDLPNNLEPVIICAKGFEGDKVGILVAVYSKLNHLWATGLCSLKDGEVIAWRDIETFEEEL